MQIGRYGGCDGVRRWATGTYDQGTCVEVGDDGLVKCHAWEVDEELDDGGGPCDECPTEVEREERVALPVGSLDWRVPKPSLVNLGTAWGLSLSTRG